MTVLPQSLRNSTVRLSLNRGIRYVDIGDIIHLRAWGNYTFIYTKECHFLLSKTLSYYINQLPKSSFVQTQRSQCINLDYSLHFDSQMRFITLKNQSQIPIARTRKKAVKHNFENHKTHNS